MLIAAEDKVLPKPKFKSLAELNRYKNLCLWLPVPIIRRKLPWGYQVDPNNPKVALPNEKALACFIKAYEYLKAHSYQTVAEWMVSCGFPLSDDGVILLMRQRPYYPEIKLPYEERLKL